jgi:AMP nucleosidase
MVGHCDGLLNTQTLGDFVLGHGYLREDHVLDDDLPIWTPIPALAEIQVALENAVAEVTELEGYDLKRIMRTGTVATIDNRNWELRDQSGPVQRLSHPAPSRWIWKAQQSRPMDIASACHMERCCACRTNPCMVS